MVKYLIYLFSFYLGTSLYGCGGSDGKPRKIGSDFTVDKLEAKIKHSRYGLPDSLFVQNSSRKLTMAIPQSEKSKFHIVEIKANRVILFNDDLSKRNIFKMRTSQWTTKDIKKPVR